MSAYPDTDRWADHWADGRDRLAVLMDEGRADLAADLVAGLLAHPHADAGRNVLLAELAASF